MAVLMAGDAAPTTAPASLTIEDCRDAGAWDAFVEAHPEASIAHLFAWRGIFESVFGHDTRYFAARRHGTIIGVLPVVCFRGLLFGRFLVSLPFLNHGGVLAADDETARALLDAAIADARARRASHLEVRHTAQRFPDLQAKRHKVSMTMGLAATTAETWDGVDRKARNQVRKAGKSGLVACAGGPELLAGFYGVFAANMRDLGTPVYHERFFRAVLARFPDRTRVHQVRLGDEVLAASITLSWRDTVEVPWASSLRQHRDKCPNNLLYWAMIERAIADGFRVFDFGRSTPGEGTYQFKAQWGARPGPMVWEYWLANGRLPDQSPRNTRFQAAIRAWRRLPLAVTNRLGPVIVRNIP